MGHWSSVKDFELHNLAVLHTSYALHRRELISRRACSTLFDQANLIGLATDIAATSRFSSKPMTNGSWHEGLDG